MSLKKSGLALLAVFALSAIVANSAAAAATTGVTSWYKEGVKVTEGFANGLPVTCAQNGELTITTTVGKSNTPLKLKATGTECPEGDIDNLTVEGKEMALATAKLKFTGVTVVEPATCSLSGGKIETATVFGELFMDGLSSDLKLSPLTGETFTELEIEGCVIAGTYLLKGSVFGREEKLTGESEVVQKVSFSQTINEGAGGALTVGGHAAAINGNLGISLSAPNAGKKFESK